MRIAVVGTGYVGLVTGVCFAEVGHNVICMDNDKNKIQMLQNGQIPIWEPGLDEMVSRNMGRGLLRFTDDMHDAVNNSYIVFIAVGTPPDQDGSADLQYVLAAVKSIAECMESDKMIVDKSTVPIGTADKVKALMSAVLRSRSVGHRMSIVSNPEFLKEGAAISDFMTPDRVIIGTDNPHAQRIMVDLYKSFELKPDQIITMSIRSAEMTKYASNAMLATKISFINEMAILCEKYGADINEVKNGIGSDMRIGYHFINPGVGYGGSCFPKDVRALIHMSSLVDFDPSVLTAVEKRNYMQKRVLAEKVKSVFGNDLSGLCFGVWGLTFKPNTDDMREASSTVIISILEESGASVRAYDPVANDTAASIYTDTPRVVIVNEQYKACENADALLLITEWSQFTKIDFKKLNAIMRGKVIFDGRNLYSPEMVVGNGFRYIGVGRSSII